MWSVVWAVLVWEVLLRVNLVILHVLLAIVSLVTVRSVIVVSNSTELYVFHVPKELTQLGMEHVNLVIVLV